MKTLERCQWHRSNIYFVGCEHISNLVLIVDFEQTNICWVHIEKIHTFEDKIKYIMRYVKCEQNLLTNRILTFAITTIQVNQLEIFGGGVYFRH